LAEAPAQAEKSFREILPSRGTERFEAVHVGVAFRVEKEIEMCSSVGSVRDCGSGYSALFLSVAYVTGFCMNCKKQDKRALIHEACKYAHDSGFAVI
jgi:hypothetical protein